MIRMDSISNAACVCLNVMASDENQGVQIRRYLCRILTTQFYTNLTLNVRVYIGHSLLNNKTAKLYTSMILAMKHRGTDFIPFCYYSLDSHHNSQLQPEELYRFIFSDHVSAKDGRVWDETTRTHLAELIGMSVEELDKMVKLLFHPSPSALLC